MYTALLVLFYIGWHDKIIPEFVKKAGILAPIIYIFFASLKAIFPIIPGEVLVVLGVILFGPFWGLLYAVIGLSIGSSAAFFLARRYGQPFVKWLMGEKRFERVNKLSGDKTLFTFFLVYLAPGTPDDFVTYIAGLTSVPFLWFLPLCVLGRLPSYLIYVVGGLSIRTLNFRLMFFWWAVMFAVVGILYFSGNRIKNLKTKNKESKIKKDEKTQT